MSRRQKDPLRALNAEERAELTRLSRSRGAPAAWVARATALLAVAEGQSYLAAARQPGRRDNDTVAAWVARFNREGLPAVRPRHGGPSIRYGAAAQQRILEEVRRPPDRERDGTATWSLSRLQQALRRGWAADGEHLHDLADVAWGRSELAAQPHLVRDRRGLAQPQARRPGGGPRSRCGGEKP